MSDESGEGAGEEPVAPAADDGPLFTASEKREFLRDLKEAYYLGATRVKFRERDVSYRNRAEMKAIIDELEAELNPRRPRKNAILTTFNRGYR